MIKILLQEKQVAEIARRQVTSALREILSDPDAGLVLQNKATLRLKKSLKSKTEGKLKDLSVVLKKYSF